LRWADRPAASTNRRFIAERRGASYLQFVSEPQVTLTENAARRVAWIAERQHKPAILRLAVDGGGCAGFTYKFELAEEAEGDDEVVETDGVKLVVDPMSFELVKGSAVDFVEDLGGAAFRVTNPNAQSGCGCGSSFSV
jgi:iron-sulfur cluster assembly accessory protein